MLPNPGRKCRRCGSENCSLVAEKEFHPTADPRGPQIKRGGMIYVYRCRCGNAFSFTETFGEESPGTEREPAAEASR